MRKSWRCFKSTVSLSFPGFKVWKTRPLGISILNLCYTDRILRKKGCQESMKCLGTVLAIGMAAAVSVQMQCASLASAVPSCGVSIKLTFTLSPANSPAQQPCITSAASVALHGPCMSVQFLSCQRHLWPGRTLRALCLWSSNGLQSRAVL